MTFLFISLSTVHMYDFHIFTVSFIYFGSQVPKRSELYQCSLMRVIDAVFHEPFLTLPTLITSGRMRETSGICYAKLSRAIFEFKHCVQNVKSAA